MHMQEYWVNVYKNGKDLGLFHHDKGMAIAVAGIDVIYRIHVKMKPVKTVKKNIAIMPFTEKFNWMD